MDIIQEYASLHNLSEEDKKHLIKLTEDAYLDKKLEYYLEDKLVTYSSFLNFSANLALNKLLLWTRKRYVLFLLEEEALYLL